MSDSASFHTPDELLASAKQLFAAGDEALYRAVVLEGITALEAMIQATVFPLLRRTLPIELVSWLEERTRMDFDSRLAVLAPIAIGRAVERQSELWKRYKNAKRVRNEVTHRGRRISREEAHEVLSAIEAWITFLSSTVEVSLSLDDLKARLEAHSRGWADERDLLWHIADFYRSADGVRFIDGTELPWKVRPDLVLDFGDNLVAIETKLIRDETTAARLGASVAEKARVYLEQKAVTRAAVVLGFVGFAVPPHLMTPVTYHDGQVTIIGVHIAAFGPK